MLMAASGGVGGELVDGVALCGGGGSPPHVRACDVVDFIGGCELGMERLGEAREGCVRCVRGAYWGEHHTSIYSDGVFLPPEKNCLNILLKSNEKETFFFRITPSSLVSGVWVASVDAVWGWCFGWGEGVV